MERMNFSLPLVIQDKIYKNSSWKLDAFNKGGLIFKSAENPLLQMSADRTRESIPFDFSDTTCSSECWRVSKRHHSWILVRIATGFSFNISTVMAECNTNGPNSFLA